MKSIYASAAMSELRTRARENSVPISSSFELTARCNLNCKMCYIHTCDNAHIADDELTTEQWKKIMDEAYDAGMMFALLSGGECLLRKHFKERYLHLHNKGVFVSINTNGVALTEDIAKFLSLHRPESVQITLYGSDNEKYRNVCGVPAFDKVDRAIQLIQKYSLPLRIAITASKYMKDDFQMMYSYLKSMNVDTLVSYNLIAPRDGTEDVSSLTPDEIIQMELRKRQLDGKAVHRADSAAPAPGGNSDAEQFGLPCSAGLSAFVITPKGDMIPCSSLPEIHVNVLKNGFREAWEYVNHSVKTIPAALECIGCPYNGKCVKCPAQRHNGIWSGHCNPQICDLSVKRFNAGLLTLKK